MRKVLSPRLLLIAILCLTGIANAAAQYTIRSGRQYSFRKRSNHVVQKYTEKLDSLIQTYSNWKYEGADTLSNPYYASLFGGSTLNTTMLQHSIGNHYTPARRGEKRGLESSEHIYEMMRNSNDVLTEAYAHNPWLVRSEDVEHGTLDIDREIRENSRPPVNLAETFDHSIPAEKTETLPVDDEEVDIVVRKPNFWTFKENFSMQFTQYYVSDNWYKGGESNVSFLATTTLEANFNNQRKVTFDNKLEMKLGFQSSPSDEKHKFKTNADLLRLTNKFGVKAIKNWSYTATLQSWTQFCRGYKSNDDKVYSDFMSPFESLLSLGMDYKLSKKKFTLSASLAPLALKLKFVDRRSLITKYGLDAGHHALWTYGSNITINYKWDIVKNISWTGRIYYFTDYSKTQIEWENTFNLTINKYLSTKLFLYPRFDDARKRKEGESYFQFNELLSVGLNVNF